MTQGYKKYFLLDKLLSLLYNISKKTCEVIRTLIVCLDPKGGMLFNNRRQTIDYELVSIIEKSYNDIYIFPFSEEYFSNVRCTVSDNPFLCAGSDSTIFLESGNALEYAEKIDKLIIYRWSSVYPADTYFDIVPLDCGFKLRGKITFSTTVHKNIIKEIYRK